MTAEAPIDPDPTLLDGETDEEPFGVRIVAVDGGVAGGRVDKVLADLLPEMSRARVQALIAQGHVSRDGAPISDASAKAAPGDYRLAIPPPIDAVPQPETIPLNVLFEDEYLIVVDKPAGDRHPAGRRRSDIVRH